MNILMVGNSRRITEATEANSESSRSHAVLQITVTKSPKTKGIKFKKIIGKLST